VRSLPQCERAALRKTVSVDEQLLRPAGGEQHHLKLLSRLERGRKKLRNIHVSFCSSSAERELQPAGRVVPGSPNRSVLKLSGFNSVV